MSVRSGGTVQQQIQREYEILQKIGTGSFGYIISVRSKQDGRIYACKIEKNHGKKTILVEKEFRILLELRDSGHFPQVYSLQTLSENSYIIMEKLDHNMEELFIKYKKKFSVQTVALIVDQSITAMKYLHESGFLHRDLKPQNFMIHNNSHLVKLIDFGLSDTIRVRRASTLIGNVRFSSRDAHFGNSSKKDDLQSLLYVLFYLLTGFLPWQSASKSEIELEINRRADLSSRIDSPILTQKYQFIDQLKFPDTRNEIKKAFYEEFTEIGKYIFNLASQKDPNYNWLEQRCERLLLLSGTRRDSCFDWCPGDCPKKPKQELWDIFSLP